VLAVGGLTDPYRNAVLELVEHLPGRCEGVLGPWAHGYPHVVGPGPQIGFLGDVARFFGEHLRGDAPIAVPRLRTFVAHPDPPRVETRTGRFASLDRVPDATLALQIGDGTLGRDPLLTPVEIPTDLRSGQGAGAWCPYSPAVGPAAQEADDARSTCFDSAPLESSLVLVGFPVCEFELAADAPLAQITARLCAVSPGGSSVLLARGTLNLTHRSGHDRLTPLIPGEINRYHLRIDAVSHEIPPGYRVRLALSPSSWPWVWPSPTLVTLRLSAGVLRLPTAPDDAPAVELGPAEAIVPVATILSDPRRGEEVLHDENGVLTQTAQPDYVGGRRTIVPLGIDVTEQARARWRVRVDDPLSAEVQNTCAVTLARDGWSVRVETEATLRCTADRFLTTSVLRAFEGDALVRERTFESSVRREGG
jgi:uncharacterized protein